MCPAFQINALFGEINLPIISIEQVSFRPGSTKSTRSIADIIITLMGDIDMEDVINQINQFIDDSTLDILQDSFLIGFNIESKWTLRMIIHS